MLFLVSLRVEVDVWPTCQLSRGLPGGYGLGVSKRNSRQMLGWGRLWWESLYVGTLI